MINKIIQKLKGPEKTRLYSSFEKALEDCSGYSDEKIGSIVHYKTKRLLEQLKSGTLINAQNLINVSYYDFCSRQLNKPALNILDIGGALGADYFIEAGFHEKLINRFSVLETKMFCDIGSNDSDLHSRIEFLSELKKEDYDLLKYQGSLQYLPNPLGQLKNALEHSNASFLLLSRLLLTNDSEFIYIQNTNLYDHGPGPITSFEVENRLVSYPCTVLNKKQLLDQLNSIGFNTKFETKDFNAFIVDENGEKREYGEYSMLLSR